MGSSSWVAVAAVGEAARVVALVPVPEDAGVCLAEAEELLAVRDRITSALAARVGRVHRAGEAKNHGHASTKLWLRSAGGMTPAGAGRLVTMGMELARLPQVRERFAEGGLPEGVVEAICMATAGLTDEQAATVERILLELANSAGAAEVAKAGRYLRAVLDPDGHEKDEQADFDRRFFRVRRRRGGGLEGEFYLPVEAAARLQHMLDVYAKPKAEGDDRPLSVRNADALIAFLENKIVTELLVLVNAESLPDDPPSATPSDDGEPTIEEPADEEPDEDPDEDPDEEPAGAEPGTRPSAVSPERTSTSPERTVTVPPAGDDRSAGEDGSSTVAPSAGDDTSPAAPSAASHAACRATSSAAAGAGAGASAASGAGADGQEPATGRAAAGSSPMDGPAAAWPHFDPTDSHERGDLRDCDDVQQGHADDPDDDSDDDPGTQEEGIERGHRRNRARPQQAPPQQAYAPDPPSEHDVPPGAEHGGDAWPGGDAWTGMGADAPPGSSPPGAGGNVPPGVWLRGLPGLILATGQLLPVVSVHRLARTSSLVRIVMNAAGQVLDMGRKVRLATPAQRRAVFARYATCWVDGCPLPATLCQVDHAENWCSGGLTDLKLLGPACQFHNRDRYRHPTHYTRRKIGDDRWAFTYRNPRITRRRL
ncbi:HNH endonuclease [Microbispora sp. NBC_01189]|uniref:HNH endonuclease signature motif containing protein n=1 Tax=Microbispora sp. NBC_01189 TaxID=2903583 RepID=UPI002E12018D|nr:HNH endonuclease [Microbispora sp. NBC_01189]